MKTNTQITQNSKDEKGYPQKNIILVNAAPIIQNIFICI